MKETYLTKQDFEEIIVSRIQQEMSRIYSDEVTVTVTDVLKTNGEKRGIITSFPDNSPAPTTYIDTLYEDYERGISIEDIIDTHCKLVKEFRNTLHEVPELSVEEAKKRIILTMVNTERNQRLLANVPHFDLEGGISAIPRWYISPEASFVVTNSIAAEALKLTPAEVLKIGQHNIDEMDFKIQTIQDVLKGIFLSENMDTEAVDSLFSEEEQMVPMLVVTSPNNMQGANSLLSEKTLKRVSQILGGDVVIIGSSINEILALPRGGMEPEEIRKMVHDVNMNVVLESEFLSGNIWKYDGVKLSLIPDSLSLEEHIDSPEVKREIHYAGMAM